MFLPLKALWFGSTYVADDCYFGDAVQDIEPYSNVLGSVGDRPSHFTHELVRVNADLKDVVGKGEERSQRKCSHEDRDETELENFWSKTKRELTKIHFNSRDQVTKKHWVALLSRFLQNEIFLQFHCVC